VRSRDVGEVEEELVIHASSSFVSASYRDPIEITKLG
jgi:hypothetical protein